MRKILLNLVKFLEQATAVGDTYCGNDLNDDCSSFSCKYFRTCLHNANLKQQLEIIKDNILAEIKD